MSDLTERELLPAFIRKRIEEACDSAEHPKGMSVHDGMARIHASDIRRLLQVFDMALREARRGKQEPLTHVVVDGPDGKDYVAKLRVPLYTSPQPTFEDGERVARLRKLIPGCDCNDPSQCWEPCGELGHSEHYVRIAPPETEEQVRLALLEKKP